MFRSFLLRCRSFVVLSVSLLLGGCAAGSSQNDARALEKYLLDGQRSLQENDYERAERMFRQSVAYGLKLGKSDWRLALAEGRLGKVLINNRKEEEAKKVLTASIDHFRGAGAGLQDSANLVAKERGEVDSLLGLLLLEENDIGAARPYLEEAAATLAPFWAASKAESERDTLAGIGYARAVYGLAKIREHDSDDIGAAKYYEEALKVIDEERVPVPLRVEVAGSFARFLKRKGNLQRAEQVEQKQEEYEKFNPGGTKAIARDAWRDAFNKGREAAHDDRVDKADHYFAEAFKQVGLYEKDGDDALQTLIEWSRVKQRNNDSAGADALLNQAERMAVRIGGPRSVQYDNYLQAKDRVLKLQHKYEEEEALLLEQVKLREELRGKDNFHVGETLKRLSSCRYRMNKLPQALADSKRAIAIFRKTPQRNLKELKEAYDDLIMMLEKGGDEEAVRKYKFERAVLRRDIIKWDSEQHRN